MQKTKIVVKQTEKGMLLFINDAQVEGITYLDVSINGDKEVNLNFTSLSCDLEITKEKEKVEYDMTYPDGNRILVPLKD